MFDDPLTIEAARVRRYGRWAGNKDGLMYRPERCAYSVYPKGCGPIANQCSKKNGHGPASLYCKVHSKMVTPKEAK